jgi:uncharacterized protein (TIGR02646 family)
VKACQQLPEPDSLTKYRAAKPEATWDEMKNDPFDSGQQAGRETKAFLVRGQRALCAYCESRLADDCTEDGIEATKANQRVEHFHPKSDPTRPPNWHLHWANLVAVCHGGSKQDVGQQEDVIFPLPTNLSCDAYKEYSIEKGTLPAAPEGWLLCPYQVPAFPTLVRFAPDGAPEPHPENCAGTNIQGNRYPDTPTLVSKTIEFLNLGCSRLNTRRCIVKAKLDKRIELARKKSPGVPAQEVMLNVARSVFPQDAQRAWPEFFTVVRQRLGPVAEQHLQEIGFVG